MDTVWLQDFLVLAETGNFTRAANRRRISQAAFSRRIKALENWTGTALVDRSSVPVTLTTKGRIFEIEARQTLQRLQLTRSNLREENLSLPASIEVTLPQSIASSYFAEWWREWSRDTNVTVNTRVGNVSESIAQFLAGGSDMLVSYRSDAMPVMLDPRNFQHKLVMEGDLRPYCAAGSTLLDKIRQADAGYSLPLIMYRNGSFFARLVDGLLEQSATSMSGHTVIATDVAHLVMECIIQDMGMGWLPSCAIPKSRRHQLQEINLPGLFLELPIYAYVHRQRRSLATDRVWQQIPALNDK